jgi:uncharacterized membrane protein YqiK
VSFGKRLFTTEDTERKQTNAQTCFANSRHPSLRHIHHRIQLAKHISLTGKAEAEKVQLMGEAQGVAYREQVNALGAQGVAVVETLKVIGEKGVRITPDVLATGGGSSEGGGIGTLLLLNLFREQMKGTSSNGEK